MTDNPYVAPQSDPAGAEVLKERLVLGVVAGVAVDLGGTLLTSLILAVGVSIVLALRGMSQDDIAAVLTSDSPTSALSLSGMFLGLLMSMWGANVCARVARVPNYRPVIIMAVIVTIAGIWLSGGQQGWWMLVLGVALSFGAMFLGARGAVRRLVRQRDRANSQEMRA